MLESGSRFAPGLSGMPLRGSQKRLSPALTQPPAPVAPSSAPSAVARAGGLTVGIDIRRAGPFGVGTYIKNLVRSLLRVAPENEYVLIGTNEHLQHLGELNGNFRLGHYDRRPNARWSHLDYGLALHRLGLDVFHMPHRWVPLSTPGPYVATLHDLNNILFPPEDANKYMQRIRLLTLGKGLRGAERVITVSEATKKDAVKRLRVQADRIRVVYDAVDDQVSQPVKEQERRTTLERYSIADPFILYAGRIQVHKNVPRLIEAFAVVKSKLENHWKFHNLRLIIIGDDISAFPNVRHTVMRTRMQDSVRFLGFVPIETLRVFYACATAFLFPSLYEGFGLPPLEAMAHGTPVVTSNVSSMPEAVGQAAVLVNPENVFDIARGLEQVLVDDDCRADLRRRGFEQLRKFSWDESAKRVVEIYHEAAKVRG